MYDIPQEDVDDLFHLTYQPPQSSLPDYSDCESIDSDTRYEMEVALYSQIHHDVNDTGQTLLHDITIETATEKNGVIYKTAPSVESKMTKVKTSDEKLKTKDKKSSKVKKKEKLEKKPIKDCLSEFLHRDLSENSKIVEKIKPKNILNKIKIKKSSKTDKKLKKSKEVIVLDSGEEKVTAEQLFSVESSEDSDVICLDDDVTNCNANIQLNNLDNGSNKIVIDSSTDLIQSNTKAVTDWSILEADRFKHINNKSRYFIECMNCRKQGHLSKHCPLPKKQKPCLLCGSYEHQCRRCPHSLCYNCYKPGHEKVNCSLRKNNPREKCSRCSMYGHNKGNCSDIWRQYHVTTEPGPPVKNSQKQNRNVMCCNCGKRGHFVYDCRSPLMGSFRYPSFTLTAEYDSYDVFKPKKRKFDSDSEDEVKIISKPKPKPKWIKGVEKLQDMSVKRNRKEERKLKKLMKKQAKFDNSFQGKKTLNQIKKSRKNPHRRRKEKLEKEVKKEHKVKKDIKQEL